MNATIEDIQVLLEDVEKIRERSREEIKRTGASFNIFSILKAEHYETSTHSAFLREMLDPEGLHKRGGLFLGLFREMLVSRFPDENIQDLNLKQASVDKEVHLGRIRNNHTEGGRADIVVKGINGVICVENKIYAEDQKNQLYRYHRHYSENGKRLLLLYLTLYGNSPSDGSAGGLSKGKNYFTISYSKDILSWLIQCQAEVKQTPIIHEAIGQYIELIKKLTGQSMSATLKKELTKLITTQGNIENFLAVNQAFHDFLRQVDNKLDAVNKRLRKELSNYVDRSEIWKDKQVKLQKVLVFFLRDVHGVSGIQLKLRLSPYGWRIELWNLNEKDVGEAEVEYGKNGELIVGRREFDVNIEEIVKEANKAVRSLRPFND